MCGIAGILSLTGERVVPGYLQAMADSLRHRGPDDEGYLLVDASAGVAREWRGGDTVPEQAVRLSHIAGATEAGVTAGLAHRRLSIIDVSAAGHQPMASADGTLWLVFNGEIYNYVELRRELESLGYRFQSDCDTEVLLRAYEAWGEECLSRFNGMWAFAVVDLRRRRLFCARDRLGVKPFYYWFDGKTFAFASEIKALLRLPFVERTANEPLVWDYLVLGALDHTDETFFRDIQSLGAGQRLLLPFDGGLRRDTYWRLPVGGLAGGRSGAECSEAVARVRELVTDAVRLRLRSDVSVGFCLSGGLDSSTIVRIADQLLDESVMPQVGDRLKTFTLAFDDRSFDEREYAREVIERSRVSPFLVLPTGEELLDDYERMLAFQDEPIGGPSVYGQYRVIKLAREAGVKVLLDGQGGDELFGGYYRYFGLYLVNLLRQGNLREAAVALRTNGTIIWRQALFLAGMRHLPTALAQRLLVNGMGTASPVDPAFFAAYKERAGQYLDEMRACSSVGDYLAMDMTRRSLPRLLRYEDRNSMAFSLESRVPFADDLPLIEFVSSLPDSAKMRGGWSKYVLRQAMAGVLPEKVRWRRGKLGFSVPEQQWAVESRRNRTWHRLLESRSQYLRPGFLTDYLKSDRVDKTDASMIWKLVDLTVWERSLRDTNRTDAAIPAPAQGASGRQRG